jgi:hypothetical protein
VKPRTVLDLDHEELATLAKEHLLGGHLIDRAGMPVVIGHGVEVMRDVAIDEWMAASPIYAKRMQRLLGFEGDTVEVCMKGMQLDVGAPPEFMDFRFSIIDDHHGTFHLDHCGALMDVEPLGDEFVVAMCHHIEDPTFDATGWATNPRLRMRPLHRPPRVPADRHPHCEWNVTIETDIEPSPTPVPAVRLQESNAARLPLATFENDAEDGYIDYTRPLDPDLNLRDFATSTLRAIVDEVCLQGHLLAMGFSTAVEQRFGPEAALDASSKQFTGVAGAVAERLRRAFRLASTVTDVATVFDLHPAFHPRSYVDWRVTVEADSVALELGDCPASMEREFGNWITLLAKGHEGHDHDRALAAIAAAVDPHWSVRPDGPRRWQVERAEKPARELPEVTVTKLSTGMAHGFVR